VQDAVAAALVRVRKMAADRIIKLIKISHQPGLVMFVDSSENASDYDGNGMLQLEKLQALAKKHDGALRQRIKELLQLLRQGKQLPAGWVSSSGWARGHLPCTMFWIAAIYTPAAGLVHQVSGEQAAMLHRQPLTGCHLCAAVRHAGGGPGHRQRRPALRAAGRSAGWELPLNTACLARA
jgi:hypothetical protein